MQSPSSPRILYQTSEQRGRSSWAIHKGMVKKTTRKSQKVEKYLKNTSKRMEATDSPRPHTLPRRGGGAGCGRCAAQGPQPNLWHVEALDATGGRRNTVIFRSNSGRRGEEAKAARYRRLLGWDAISPARLVQIPHPMRGLLPRFAIGQSLRRFFRCTSTTRVMTGS